MKKLLFLSGVLYLFVAGAAASQQYDNLSKLIKSGASEEVVIAYINASDSSYNLSSDEILHLKEYGASSNVIVAAIQHKGSAVAASGSQVAPSVAPKETSTVVSPRSYEVYRVGPYWRPWRRVEATYWYPKNYDKINQAFQIDVASLLQGAFSVNYEYLLAHQHGLVLKGSYYDGWGLGSHGESGELDYRWHFSRSMNSGFIGAFINVGRNYGNVSDLWYSSDDTDSYKQTYVTIGPDIGKRWISPWGFSIVAQVGYGYTWSKFDDPVPDQSTQDKLKWLTGFNYEVSLGYAF
jgi:Protein of unknown function (DUF3575)